MFKSREKRPKIQVNVYERNVEMFSIQFDLFNVEVLVLN